jgi:AcrR family transcriptional regulator
MAARKPDRRTERSRAALMSAFVEILLGEGYEALTVERVAERANVGRSTFYMHYTGKEDILRQSLTRPSSHLAVLVGRDVEPAALIPILEHFREQKKLNRVFLNWPIRPIWVKCLAAMIEPRLAQVSRLARARPALPLGLIALQLAEAQVALVAHWLLGSAACKSEAVAEALVAETRALVAALLRLAPDAIPTIPNEKLRYIHV